MHTLLQLVDEIIKCGNWVNSSRFDHLLHPDNELANLLGWWGYGDDVRVCPYNI